MNPFRRDHEYSHSYAQPGSSSSFDSYYESNLDLNQASADQLLQVPGIGRTLSDRIVEYRKLNGPFCSFSELSNIKGIGPQRIGALQENTIISQQSPYENRISSINHYENEASLNRLKTKPFSNYYVEPETTRSCSSSHYMKNRASIGSSFETGFQSIETANDLSQPRFSDLHERPAAGKKISWNFEGFKVKNELFLSSEEPRRVKHEDQQNFFGFKENLPNSIQPCESRGNFVSKKSTDELAVELNFKSPNPKIIDEECDADKTYELSHKKKTSHETLFKYDLNKASVHELQQIPGIGLVLAQRINRHREYFGFFQSFDDLLNVNGIQVKKLEQIKQYSTISKESNLVDNFQPDDTKYPTSTSKLLSASNLDREDFEFKQELVRDESFISNDESIVNRLSHHEQEEESLVDLNEITQQELRQIPGIGITIAMRIAHYRENVGPFKSFEDLYRVRGIRENLIETMKSYVKLSDTDRFASKMKLTSSKDETKKLYESSGVVRISPKPIDQSESTAQMKCSQTEKNDLNYATSQQLSKVPGVSEELAQRIVNYRHKYGFFGSFSELKDSINGLGNRKVEDIRKKFFIADLKVGKNGLPIFVEKITSKTLECTESSIEEYKKLTCKKDQIMFLHMNIDSLKQLKNFEKLQSLIEKNKYLPDVICITEPNKPNEKDRQLDKYHKLILTPAKGRKGGAAVYVKSNETKFIGEPKILQELQFHPCAPPCELCKAEPIYENLWIELQRKRDKTKFVVGIIYRHPTSDKYRSKDLTCFSKKLNEILNKLEGKTFYLLGDFNLNLFENSFRVEQFCKLLESYSCKLLITKPTTFKQTLIDHIYTNDKISTEARSGVIVSHEENYSHHPVYCLM